MIHIWFVIIARINGRYGYQSNLLPGPEYFTFNRLWNVAHNLALGKMSHTPHAHGEMVTTFMHILGCGYLPHTMYMIFSINGKLYRWG